jgi:hypothetical protein
MKHDCSNPGTSKKQTLADSHADPSASCGLAARAVFGVFSTLCAAITSVRPRLFWLSVSTIATVPDFLAGYSKLYERAVECGVPVVVGGRALTEEIRRTIQYAAHGDTLRHLISFAGTLNQQG